MGKKVFGIFKLTKDRMNNVGICHVPGLHTYSPALSCLVGLAEFSFNGSCVKLHCINNFDNSKFYYLVIIPKILNGLSLILVFLTLLEFICARAPHKMKARHINRSTVFHKVHKVPYCQCAG